MGTLVGMHYPTKLAFGAADHTYVMCSTGLRAWGCWGGKTGGTVLCSGPGSTHQADAIAEPNEHAGVTCYLVNGVCHQAANRVLFPAGLLVTGARGYGLSSFMFGTFGRLTGPFGTCSAPFDKHTGITGDLPACLPPALPATSAQHDARLPHEIGYFNRVSLAYEKAPPATLRRGPEDERSLIDFMVELSDYHIEFKLGNRLGERQGRFRDIRADTEKSRINLENGFAQRDMSVMEFVARFNLQTIAFQKQAAGLLGREEYEALFDVKYGEFIVLADPEIIPRAYPPLTLRP
jgi:hypothetical protein